MKRFIVMLIGVIACICGGSASSAAAGIPEAPEAAYTYDAYFTPAQLSDVGLERGPPASPNRATAYDAVNSLSRVASSRSAELASGSTGTYATTAPATTSDDPTTTTGGHVLVGGGHLSSLPRSRVAANSLPEALTVGKNAEEGVHVYTGVREGKDVYAGITNNLMRRQLQHGDRFVLQQMTEEGVARGEARAIEQSLIVRNPGFENKINSISPSQPYYQHAVDWGESWLQGHGF